MKINKTSSAFLGRTIDGKGISLDSQKTAAISKMASSKSTTELRRFMGIINQLGKFFPQIAELSKPMRELLSSKRGASSQEQTLSR